MKLNFLYNLITIVCINNFIHNCYKQVYKNIFIIYANQSITSFKSPSVFGTFPLDNMMIAAFERIAWWRIAPNLNQFMCTMQWFWSPEHVFKFSKYLFISRLFRFYFNIFFQYKSH